MPPANILSRGLPTFMATFFAFLNIVMGYLLIKLPIGSTSAKKISWVALAGMLMPIGILSEVLFGLPPFLVIIGGISMVISAVWFGLAVLRIRFDVEST